MPNDLLISEVFGPTFQGEGPSAGQLASFVRLGLCNLDCKWCDTPFTWDWSGKNGPPQDKTLLGHRSAESILQEVTGYGAPLVVITGGEPLVQANRLGPLIGMLTRGGMRVEVETNGTLTPPTWKVDWNVSPKLSGSGVDGKRVVQAIENFLPIKNARFKFVIGSIAELLELDDYVEAFDIPCERVWVMPEGRTAEQLMASGLPLAEAALRRRYNFTQRLHVLLWNDERGR